MLLHLGLAIIEKQLLAEYKINYEFSKSIGQTDRFDLYKSNAFLFLNLSKCHLGLEFETFNDYYFGKLDSFVFLLKFINVF